MRHPRVCSRSRDGGHDDDVVPDGHVPVERHGPAGVLALDADHVGGDGRGLRLHLLHGLHGVEAMPKGSNDLLRKEAARYTVPDPNCTTNAAVNTSKISRIVSVSRLY